MLTEGTKKNEEEGGTDGDEGEDVAPESTGDGRCDFTENLMTIDQYFARSIFDFETSKRHTTLRNGDEIMIERMHAERVDRYDGEVSRILFQPCLEQDHEGNDEVEITRQIMPVFQ